MSEDVLERAKIIAEKMGDRRIYYAGCWTLAEDLGYSKTGENTEFKEVAHPEDFIWCEVLPGINLLPELIAEVERLRSDMQAILVDHEVPGWAEDFRRLNDGSAFPVFEVAKKWHAAYRKAQNSNLIRKKQTEDQDARIKELEANNKRLEAAFLRSNAAMRYYQEGNRGPWPQLGEKFKEPYQEQAREALKRIKEGGKDE